MGPAAASALGSNLMLGRLPQRDREMIAGHLEPFSLQIKRVIYDPDTVIEHVYFPQSGMVSLLAVFTDGTGVETSSIGREGIVGLPLFHRVNRVAEQAVVQLPGRAFRMTAEAFGDCVAKSPALRDALHRYSMCLFMLAAQSVACMSKHMMAKRLARWLLHAADQSGTESLLLTHVFASQMLGVRRASVTVAANVLRKKGLINYTRKRVVITSRAGLEEFACECYQIIRSTYDRLLFGAESANPAAGVESSRDGITLLRGPHS